MKKIPFDQNEMNRLLASIPLPDAFGKFLLQSPYYFGGAIIAFFLTGMGYNIVQEQRELNQQRVEYCRTMKEGIPNLELLSQIYPKYHSENCLKILITEE